MNLRRFVFIPLSILFYIGAWTLTGGWLSAESRMSNLILVGIQALLCVVGIVFWLGFFSQFVLPVRTIRQRLMVFGRLLLHLLGQHGPAIFVENGQVRAHVGEEKRVGPGVVWLDTASGAVLRTAVRFTRAIGPGVHFTKRHERIAGTVDLHTQNQSIGPRPDEDPFATAPQDDSEEAQLAFEGARSRAQETRAITRDDVEIIPKIIVIFKIDAHPVEGDAPGSRFGYNAESVRRAVTSNSIDPNQADEESQHVMWNEMPAYVAADIWREMLNKYRLEDIFHPLPFQIDLGNPPQEMTQMMQNQPAPPPEPRNALQSFWWEISGWMAQKIDILDRAFFSTPGEPPPTAPNLPPPPPMPQQENNTVLQFIQDMVRTRMAQPYAPVLDDNGRPTGEWFESPEYKEMARRGIQVRAVIITALHFREQIENTLVRQWTTNWMAEARRRSELIEQQNQEVETEWRHRAQANFSETVSTAAVEQYEDAQQKHYASKLECLQKLLMQNVVKHTQKFVHDHIILRRRLENEQSYLSDILRRLTDRINEIGSCQ